MNKEKKEIECGKCSACIRNKLNELFGKDTCFNKEPEIDFWINKTIEETEWEVHTSQSEDYKYMILNSWNTTSKLFKTDQEFIEWAAKEMDYE